MPQHTGQEKALLFTAAILGGRTHLCHYAAVWSLEGILDILRKQLWKMPGILWNITEV